MRWKKKGGELATAQSVDAGGALAEALVLAASLYYDGVGHPDGSSTVSVTLGFDDLNRVNSMEDPMADGRFATVEMDTIGAITELLQPVLASLPADQRPRAVDFAVAGGKVTTKCHY